MKYWQVRKQGAQQTAKFDCEKFVDITQLEREKLLQLKLFRRFKWYVESRVLTNGDYFGERLFKPSQLVCHEESYKATERTTCLVFQRDTLFRVLKRIIYEEAKANEELLKRHPFFSLFSTTQIKKLSNKAQEMHFSKKQFVFEQGGRPAHVFIVVVGEFELLRRSRLHKCRPESGQMRASIKNGRIEQQQTNGTSSNLVNQRKTQYEEFTIATVGRGQLICLEDVVKNRYNTTSAKCLTQNGILLAFKAQDILYYSKRDFSMYLKYIEMTNIEDGKRMNYIKQYHNI